MSADTSIEKRPPLTPAQRALAESMAAWCQQEASKWASMLCSMHGYRIDPQLREELFNSAMLAVSEAARRFDSSRGAKFSTYAVLWCRRGLQDQAVQMTRIGPSFAFPTGFIRPGTPERRSVLMYSRDGQGNGGDREDEYIPGRDSPHSPRDYDHRSSADFQTLIAKLKPREREVVLARIIDGERLHVIARRMGVCKQRVQQIYADAIDRLRASRAIRQLAVV